MAVDHAEYEAGDDGCVDRVAAATHDLDAGFARQMVHRGDHAAPRFFRRPTDEGQQHEHDQGPPLHASTVTASSPAATPWSGRVGDAT